MSSRAYPRERGGTSSCHQPHLSFGGLSPRTRGNRVRRRFTRVPTGPIPANAGEPGDFSAWCSASRAYPRERGGTRLVRGGFVLMMGLSPRTRGNLGSAHLRGIDTGPIPANAGEPARSVHGVPWCRAYPRERGGTLSVEGTLKDDQGLSPRTRGNQPERFRLDSCAGPIPANAGEPTKSRFGRCGARAYPRERGGTRRHRPRLGDHRGLSPRTRGNPRRRT